MEVLQTQITAMAAAGDAAQEKVSKVVSFSPLILTNTYRVIFLTGTPQKVLCVRLHRKSHQKSSKCQNLLTKKNL